MIEQPSSGIPSACQTTVSRCTAIDDLGAARGIRREPCQGLPSVTPGLERQRLLLGSPCNSGEDGCEPDCVAVNAFADMEWHQACLRRWSGSDI
jgi:hypothetical protein